MHQFEDVIVKTLFHSVSPDATGHHCLSQNSSPANFLKRQNAKMIGDVRIPVVVAENAISRCDQVAGVIESVSDLLLARLQISVYSRR